MKVTILRDSVRQFVKVDTFHVYDSSNPLDPELIRMNALLAKNPTFKSVYFQVKDSDWGYDVVRPETDEEYVARKAKERFVIARQKDVGATPAATTI